LPKAGATPLASLGFPGGSGAGLIKNRSLFTSLPSKIAYRMKVLPTPFGGFESRPPDVMQKAADRRRSGGGV
jgi:hypothetical protein